VLQIGEPEQDQPELFYCYSRNMNRLDANRRCRRQRPWITGFDSEKNGFDKFRRAHRRRRQQTDVDTQDRKDQDVAAPSRLPFRPAPPALRGFRSRPCAAPPRATWSRTIRSSLHPVGFDSILQAQNRLTNKGGCHEGPCRVRQRG